MEFYQKLKNIRKENGMSQEDLAAELGVSRQAVSKWENGQGFPETEKLMQIGNLFNVSLDYLLKEERAGAAADEEAGYYASREAVDGFLLSKRQGALHIGIGVAVLICSLIFTFVPGGNPGVVLFLLGAAAGVGVLVAQGFRPKRYAQLETQPLTFDSAFLKEFRNAYAARRKRYGLLIVVGIAVVIASFAGKVLIDSLPAVSGTWADAFLPPMWAVAVFLFIYAGSALGAEGMIADNAAHVKELAEDKENGWIWAFMMPLAAMAYLAIGFLWGAWHPGWLVFPVTVMICLGITGWRNSKK
ncbi:MAG TPA: helix-turn-helix transcriptional regulator [Oscillospiraceae bacterium]|nr:helix-turn-helix transcriptional regulator [Oscillospiraceae bacterium]HNW04991.1 helix-turn-helix transcriptional regulator [Oscillospiraceae bacterium]